MNLNHEVNFQNNTNYKFIYEKEVNKIISEFAKYFNIKSKIIVDLTFESADVVHQLNKEYRGVDKTTDVLSFGLEAVDFYEQMNILPLGDIIINYEKIISQAKEFNHSEKREFCYLFTHSLLHLYGYDHIKNSEAKRMNFITEWIMNNIDVRRKKMNESMFSKVKSLLKKSYAPYSDFQVACILIDKDGKEYKGVNVESAAYPSGLCAERNAIFSAVTKGARPYEFKEVHIISKKEEDVINCCGACLQVMNEFLDNDCVIYSYNNSGTKVRKSSIREMMPFVVDGGLLK